MSNKTSSFSNIDRMNLFVMVKKKAFRLVFAAFVLNIVYAIKNGTAISTWLKFLGKK